MHPTSPTKTKTKTKTKTEAEQALEQWSSLSLPLPFPYADAKKTTNGSAVIIFADSSRLVVNPFTKTASCFHGATFIKQIQV